MTPEEINRLLAEKLMGWHSAWKVTDSESCYCWCDSNGNTQMPTLSFNPWGNISHAWMVVEKMKAKGYTLLLHQQIGGLWVAGFDNEDNPKCSDDAATASAAICLAALEAVKEEE